MEEVGKAASSNACVCVWWGQGATLHRNAGQTSQTLSLQAYCAGWHIIACPIPLWCCALLPSPLVECDPRPSTPPSLPPPPSDAHAPLHTNVYHTQTGV
jgi:hypothetical protein